MTATAGRIELVSGRDSIQPASAGGGGDSWGFLLSANGRYFLFASAANNLVLGLGTNPLPLLWPSKLNVYLRDRASGTTTLVSANLSATGGGNGDSVPTGLSADGRYALFESTASDLVNGDTNGMADVFLRDIASNATYLELVPKARFFRFEAWRLIQITSIIR